MNFKISAVGLISLPGPIGRGVGNVSWFRLDMVLFHADLYGFTLALQSSK